MKDKAEKKKVSFRETIRVAWKPYKRLYTYVGPLQMAVHPWPRSRISFWRDPGLPAAGFAKGNQHDFSRRCTLMPRDLDPSFGITQRRRIGEVDRLHLPSDPRGHDRAQPDGIRQRLLHELGQQPRCHRHSQPAFCQDRGSVDGFL